MTGPRSLVGRLLAAQMLTLIVGAFTLAAVAMLVAPPLIRIHVEDALRGDPGLLGEHMEQAFARVTLITLIVAGAASLLAATAMSVLVARRIAAPITMVADAASEVAEGVYTSRIPAAELGAELDRLIAAFNVMAATLEESETTRKRLIGDVAHELRTPLATVNAYIEGLADGVREPNDATWTVLEHQTARMRRLIEDLALVSRAEERALPLRRQFVAVAALLRAAAASIEPEFLDKGVHFAWTAEANLPGIDVDPDRVIQILTNLLDNAQRHTPPGGHVKVTATGTPDEVRIKIEDNGEGIRAKDLPRIFERFFRGDAARDRGHGGSGIGLTIARALARAHGGSLTASSPGPGFGSTFMLTLPKAPV